MDSSSSNNKNLPMGSLPPLPEAVTPGRVTSAETQSTVESVVESLYGHPNQGTNGSHKEERGDDPFAADGEDGSKRRSSMVSADSERQMLLLMLLGQVCSLHDPTPRTFTVHVLSLFERGILDRDSIRFLFDLGLVPSEGLSPMSALEGASSVSQRHLLANEANADKDWNKTTSTPTTPEEHLRHILKQPSITFDQAKEAKAIRNHLERSESSPVFPTPATNTVGRPSLSPSSESDESKPVSPLKRSASAPVSPPLSSWSVESHPLSLSRYQREFTQHELLNSGSFGDVYRTTNKLDRKDYAIKRVAFGATGFSSESVQLVVREVRCLAQCDHPNCVRYYTSWLEPSWMTGSGQAVTSADQVASKRVQRRMLTDIHRMVMNTDTDPSADSLSAWSVEDTSDNHQWTQFESFRSKSDRNRRLGGGYVNQNSDDDSDYSDWSEEDGGVEYRDFSEDNRHSPLSSIPLDGFSRSSDTNQDGKNQQSNSGTNNSIGLDSFETQQRRIHNRDRSENARQRTQKQQQQKQKRRQESYQYQICLFIQMQLCCPSTLADWIRQRNATVVAERSNTTHEEQNLRLARPAFEIFRQTVRGLQHVHGKGIVHRDL
eukprot:scaffold62992_cov55-Attheya_sp.AAC.1